MGQKGLKLAFFGQKLLFLAFFFLAELGDTLTPLTENDCAQKSMAEWGGTSPPLAEKICLVVFDCLPFREAVKNKLCFFRNNS